MAIYNKYYQEEHYFGESYPELISFFKGLDSSLSVIDLGCGQGRDVLSLGELGFTVHGVDVSSVGINQLIEAAKTKKINVTASVEDYKTLNNLNKYDILLMNSMFHFNKKDIKKESDTLKRVFRDMKKGARLVLIIQESDFRRKHLFQIFESLPHQVEHEETILYKEFNATFFMISIKKPLL